MWKIGLMLLLMVGCAKEIHEPGPDRPPVRPVDAPAK
jgi:hypothetical protein